VFKARECARQRAVVFKVLLPHLVEDPRFLQRFKRSVQIATQIEHENLVNVLLYGRADASYFVVYEHYHGVTLDKVLSGHPRVPVDVALQVVLGVAAGLEACHRRQLIHRDVRPGNIVLTRGGGVKLDNLTLASDASEAGRLAFVGRVSTTAAYMSPEQTQGENIGVQTDVFSLGVVAWELLCGEGAFGLGTPAAAVERIRSASLKAVCDVNPMVEPRFGDIVQRMLEKDQTRRYLNAVEVAADLLDAMRKSGCGPDPKAVARFAEDPAAYAEWYAKQTVKALKEKAEVAGDADPTTLVGYYEKLAYFEPGNEEYRREIERLKLMVQHAETARACPALSSMDPRMTYRVILESLDTTRESKASFALKLAAKLRLPLSAVKPYVENMPAALPGGHMHRKAVFFAGLLEELGAVTRIEACRPEASRRPCPECGSEANPNAEFCDCCGHRFIAVVDLRPGLDEPEADPHAEGNEHGANPNLVRRFLKLPVRGRK